MNGEWRRACCMYVHTVIRERGSILWAGLQDIWQDNASADDKHVVHTTVV